MFTYRHEKLLAFAVIVYEYVNYSARENRKSLESHYHHINYLEANLKEKKISLD
jgi:hypothetical protein